MVQLPNNVTVGALALLLGALLGAGVYHVLFSGSGGPDFGGRTEVLELDRFLQPSDTSGQSSPDLEIRYRTKRDTVVDSVFVPIPSGVQKPRIVDQDPLRVGPDRVKLTTWDPRDLRFEQTVFSVPTRSWSSQLYGLIRIRNPPQLRLRSPTRLEAGLGLKARFRSLRGRVEGTVSSGLRPQLEAALIWEF